MKRILAYLLCAVTAFSCISNDLPFPVVVPHITSLSVEGATNVEISYERNTVVVSLPETQDLRKVRIKDFKIDSEIAVPGIELKGVHDLSSPLKFTITTYNQEYEWTIVALRPVERYFTVVGQIGSSVIDEANCRALAQVGRDVDCSNITVSSLKLGPKDISEYSIPMSAMKDFTDGISLEVTAFGLTEEWHLFVEQTDAKVEIKDINPWTREVYVSSLGVAGLDNGFCYRLAGTSEWIELEQSAISSDGGSFTAHITGLEPESEYEVYAYSGSDKSVVQSFTTDPATPLPNHSFENFSLVTGKDYYKWYNPYSPDPDGREMFWGTGNGEGPDGINGTASLGIVLTYPDTNSAPDGQYCVRCESKSFADLLACGNIFTGQFSGLVGTTGGKVHYGRPWTTRPKALRFNMRYNSGIIDLVGSYPPGEVVKVGDNDRCHIIATVGDWDYRQTGGSKESPVLVNTSEGIYFTKESSGIIGYGEYILGQSTDGWVEIEIPIEYRSLTRKPTHIIVICATSIRGDYLTGSSRSTLWVDNFRLIY